MVFGLMIRKDVKPNVVTYTSLLNGVYLMACVTQAKCKRSRFCFMTRRARVAILTT